MKRLMVSCLTLTVLLFGVNSANALSFLNDWYLDIDGAGGMDAEQVSEFIDITGPAYIQNTFVDEDTFTFEEEAAFVSNSHDGGGLWDFVPEWELTGYFTGTGTGTLDGDLSFDKGGILEIYADSTPNFGSDADASIYGANDGTKIATFSLLSGDGTVNAEGVPNGQITVTLEALDMAAGYFLNSDMEDLSLIDPIQWVLGFSTTNASFVDEPSDAVNSEFGVGANEPPFDLVVSTNGQYRLAVVPEPSTFLLLGGGLVGLGILGYRRKNQG